MPRVRTSRNVAEIMLTNTSESNVAALRSIRRFFPKLLPKNALLKTSDVDEARWVFHPVVGIVQRLRFWLVLSLIPKRRFRRLLEIGYGSGILLPELAQHCDELYAIDIHQNAAQVDCTLRHHEVHAELLRGCATSLPFQDHTFDCVIAMSCLEYIDSPDRAALEIKRVLKSEGCFIFVTPGDSPVLDFALTVLTGLSAHGPTGSSARAAGPPTRSGSRRTSPSSGARPTAARRSCSGRRARRRSRGCSRSATSGACRWSRRAATPA
jgi:SAM-dependent methyltransferase